MSDYHSKCFWCGQPIYHHQERQSRLVAGKKVDYHYKCWEESKHSEGIYDDITLEGCYTGQGD